MNDLYTRFIYWKVFEWMLTKVGLSLSNKSFFISSELNLSGTFELALR